VVRGETRAKRHEGVLEFRRVVSNDYALSVAHIRFNWMRSTNVIKREGELLDHGIVDTL
jgi:hypothetical protein